MNALEQANHKNTSDRRPLRVLLVEDSTVDAFLIEHALQRGGFDPVCERVDTAEAMSAAMQFRQWDVLLVDHAMPHFSAPEALELAKRHGLDVPFIIVSGHIEEVTAIAAMNAGAHDYIMKDRLARLVPAIQRELREAELRRAQKKHEEELRQAHDELEMRVERRTADLRAANIKLHSLLEERRRLEAELLEIAENERRRIGFDLHDDLGQKLTGLSLLLKALEQRLEREQHPCTDDARALRELSEEVISHTHNLARRFSSLDVSGDDLAAVLSGLGAHVEKMFGIPCRLAFGDELPALPTNTVAQFYKIAQEAISNAVKHGKATHVDVAIVCDAEELVLTIRNDGVPFSLPQGKKNRMGLRIMNYRARTVGASFDIQADGTEGTLVTCVLPLRNGATPAGERTETAAATVARRRREAGFPVSP